jgi:hypothetical protein
MSWRHMGEWKYSSTILDFGIRSSWVDSFTPQPIQPRGNLPRYPSDRKLGAPHSRSGRYGEKKNVAFVGNRTSAIQSLDRYYIDWAISAPI